MSEQKPREFTEDGREIHTMFDDKKVIGPPQWYIERMEALRKLPPPTPEEVHQQFETCKRLRRENAHCQKHNEYDMINPPNNDCYYCWSAYIDKHQTEESVKLFWKAMDDFDGLKC